MVPRLVILVTAAFVGFGLASLPAAAEEPQEGPSQTAIEQAQKTIVPLPVKTSQVRISTRDRWRGAPYLRSSADETLRSQALDIALPPANSAFQGGTTIGPAGVFATEDAVRHQALDKVLPPANPAWAGGGQTISGGGF
jgi:hypothetical protein